MRTDKEALKLAAESIVKACLYGVLFCAVAYLVKHPSLPVLLIAFLIPAAFGVAVAVSILLAPKPKAPSDRKAP
jgi:hypothetical protein